MGDHPLWGSFTEAEYEEDAGFSVGRKPPQMLSTANELELMQQTYHRQPPEHSLAGPNQHRLSFGAPMISVLFCFKNMPSSVSMASKTAIIQSGFYNFSTGPSANIGELNFLHHFPQVSFSAH